MDGNLVWIAGFLLDFIALDVAALCYGRDSRRWSRELPLGQIAARDVPRTSSRHPRRKRLRQARRILSAIAPPDSDRLRPTPLPSGAHPVRYLRFDLAAAGK